jgi:hypothetical protein
MTIGVMGAVVSWTVATFNDTEVSTGNTFATGGIDLLVDNESYYNGVFSAGTSWAAKDLKAGDYFFNFQDLKPGDWGEDTISLHVNTNDSWVCMKIAKTKSDDGTCNEPELDVDPTCQQDNGDIWDGNLADELRILFWADDGDNVLENDEQSKIFKNGWVAGFHDPVWWTLADKGNNVWTGTANSPLQGGKTKYIAKAWCMGNWDLSNLPVQDGGDKGRNPSQPGMGIKCNGTNVDNRSQTDLVNLDVKFYATQKRNFPNFMCSSL